MSPFSRLRKRTNLRAEAAGVSQIKVLVRGIEGLSQDPSAPFASGVRIALNLLRGRLPGQGCTKFHDAVRCVVSGLEDHDRCCSPRPRLARVHRHQLDMLCEGGGNVLCVAGERHRSDAGPNEHSRHVSADIAVRRRHKRRRRERPTLKCRRSAQSEHQLPAIWLVGRTTGRRRPHPVRHRRCGRRRPRRVAPSVRGPARSRTRPPCR
ncbi:hypothetical protein MP11Mi_35900 [Gordonia sp. MP11Mi]|uniref:Uncharacterized protein n=1 Tax=Gordonia sp. MP11Mi TaxID=3022769 RepID=A0AA97GVV6_9ACTN